MKHSKEVKDLGNKLLMISCRKAIERSRDTKGAYKDVKCSFKTPKQFFTSIKRNNKKLYEQWLMCTEIYLKNEKSLGYRPTLDRIDEKGHYFIKNIQVLSFGQNSSKAHKKK